MRVNPGYRPALSGALSRLLGQAPLPEGLAMGKGRIEATEVDVATQIAGRLLEVRVREGDRVEAGEVVAVLDWLACGGLIGNVGSHRRLDQGLGLPDFDVALEGLRGGHTGDKEEGVAPGQSGTGFPGSGRRLAITPLVLGASTGWRYALYL